MTSSHARGRVAEGSVRPLPVIFRILLICFVPASFILSGCQVRPDPGGPEALVEEWVDMWNTYDLDRVGDLFLDDPGLTYFSSEREGVIRGMAALVEHHRGFAFIPGGMEQPNRLWVEELRSDLFGDAAVLTGIWYFMRGGDDDATSPQRGPVTFVSIFREGRWWFVHMSFANYPSSETD